MCVCMRERERDEAQERGGQTGKACEGEIKIIFLNLFPLFYFSFDSPLTSLFFSKVLWSVKGASCYPLTGLLLF